MIRDTLLNGISDFDIRREILGSIGILTTAVNIVIVLVEIKEMARNAIPAPNVSVASAFRFQKAIIISKNCCSSSRNSFPANPLKQSPYPICKKQFTCIEKALVGGTPNRTLCISIAFAHVTAPSIAISRHLHQLPPQTLVDCLKAQTI